MNATPTRREIGVAALATALFAPVAAAANPETTPGLSHGAEAIHQEVVFDASRPSVYAALMTAAQFDAVSKLGVAAKSLKLGSMPTEISGEAGGSFTLFGGYIVGRHLELVAGVRLVQAWREQSWPAGAFSLASFKLSDHGAATKLVFDHTGFPRGAGKHLSIGWYQDYWDPLARFLNRAAAPG